MGLGGGCWAKEPLEDSRDPMEEGAESTSSTGSPNGTNPLSLCPNALSEDGAAEDAAGATRTTSGEVCLLRGCHLQKLRTGLSSTFAFAPWDFVAWRRRGLAARCGRRRRRKAGGLADAAREYGRRDCRLGLLSWRTAEVAGRSARTRPAWRPPSRPPPCEAGGRGRGEPSLQPLVVRKKWRWGGPSSESSDLGRPPWPVSSLEGAKDRYGTGGAALSSTAHVSELSVGI